ncbi:MAG: hypothetical protein QM757_04565 [Paludibaculum sp.]
MKWLRRFVIGAVVFVVVAYLGVLVAMVVFQRDLQYDRGGRLFALSETTLSAAEQVEKFWSGRVSMSSAGIRRRRRASRRSSISAAMPRASHASMRATKRSLPLAMAFLPSTIAAFPDRPGN